MNPLDANEANFSTAVVISVVNSAGKLIVSFNLGFSFLGFSFAISSEAVIASSAVSVAIASFTSVTSDLNVLASSFPRSLSEIVIALLSK